MRELTRKILNGTKGDFWALLFLLACCFPYLYVFAHGFTTDLQPLPLIFGSIFCVRAVWFEFKKTGAMLVPKHCLWIGCVLFYFLVLSAYYGDPNTRSVVTYSALSIYVFCGSLIVRRGYSLKIVEISIYVWGVFGLLQRFFDRSIGEALLRAMRTTYDRGVTSLAAEPSFYGAMMLFFFIIIDLHGRQHGLSKGKCLFLKALTFLQAVFLAKSMAALMIFAAYAGISQLRVNFKSITVIAAAVFAIWLAPKSSGPVVDNDDRFERLLQLALKDPIGFVVRDISGNGRLGDIAVSVDSLRASMPFAAGHGSSAWADYYDAHKKDYPFILFPHGRDNRIMSGYGTVIFELGYMGVLAILIFLGSFRNIYGRSRIFNGIGLSIVMLSSVQVALPFFGLLIGMNYGSARRRRTEVSRSKVKELRPPQPTSQLLLNYKLADH